MKKKDFQDLLHETHKTIAALTGTKGEEYSNDADDQFANFKRQAAEMGITPDKVLMVYLNKHLDGIKSYVRTKREFSEPISGRIDDAILYLILLKGMFAEERSDRNKEALKK